MPDGLASPRSRPEHFAEAGRIVVVADRSVCESSLSPKFGCEGLVICISDVVETTDLPKRFRANSPVDNGSTCSLGWREVDPLLEGQAACLLEATRPNVLRVGNQLVVVARANTLAFDDRGH